MIKSVLLLGSGGLRIGQAGEFDYSGTQALKALREEGIRTILLNPNIATVQTDGSLADQVYLLPLTFDVAKGIIERDRPDAILLGFGGQTALNLGLELEEAGVLKEYGVQVPGTSLESIRITEDRQLFADALGEIGVETPKSRLAYSSEEALAFAEEVGYPVMLRRGFSLGGLGSGRVNGEEELKEKVLESLSMGVPVLVEEYLYGWKEIEYEILRDKDGNAISICNMENLDPLGIHTGESIVVCPSQTLTNTEYHKLREIAILCAQKMGIVGECNVQFALNPKTSEYRVIEMNARLSRSSALASKASGYPIAFVAAKVMLGRSLAELKNSITKVTSAFFEPALDYVVVKMPRWDCKKFHFVDRTIGSEMKSVGEVMAIGRNFPEALQKALRMCFPGLAGFCDMPEFSEEEALREIEFATDRRLFAIMAYLSLVGDLGVVHQLSKIDLWFLNHLDLIASMFKLLEQGELSDAILAQAKKLGFSDKEIAVRSGCSERDIRERRKRAGIVPYVKRIDTVAGEFNAETNYLYLTYCGSEHDPQPSKEPPVIVLGAGPYAIGSSVEFDWCAVNTVRLLRHYGKQSVIINSNPETVSTDYDESDRLYFEEVSFERVQDIAEFEGAEGIVVSVGGQVANNLALPLKEAGFKVYGTDPKDIDRAEDRKKFSGLLNCLGIDQPEWTEVVTAKDAFEFADKVGYPVLVRPSYVLSGAAMGVIHREAALGDFLDRALEVSGKNSVVLSKFISEGQEFEVDGVADRGRIVVRIFSEHIENAGVHSGDATIVVPPQKLCYEALRKAQAMSTKIVESLNITGPFNIQFIVKEGEVKVIECNVRASRSFPFVSKVVGINLIEIMVKAYLGLSPEAIEVPLLEMDYVGVKVPLFSYHRLKGTDPVAYVEMASTGEVATLGHSLEEAFLSSWLSTEQRIAGKRLLVSIGGAASKEVLLPYLEKLHEMGWDFYATIGTHDFLRKNEIPSQCLFKSEEGLLPDVCHVISQREIDLIINIPSSQEKSVSTAGFRIRRMAVDRQVPLITDLQLAKLFLFCLAREDLLKPRIKSWEEYVTVG